MMTTKANLSGYEMALSGQSHATFNRMSGQELALNSRYSASSLGPMGGRKIDCDKSSVKTKADDASRSVIGKTPMPVLREYKPGPGIRHPDDSSSDKPRPGIRDMDDPFHVRPKPRIPNKEGHFPVEPRYREDLSRPIHSAFEYLGASVLPPKPLPNSTPFHFRLPSGEKIMPREEWIQEGNKRAYERVEDYQKGKTDKKPPDRDYKKAVEHLDHQHQEK